VDDLGVGPELREDTRHHTALLIEERQEQVLGADLGVVLGHGELARSSKSFAGFDGQVVDLHFSANVITLTGPSRRHNDRKWLPGMKTLLWTGLLLGSFLTVASADPAETKPSKAKATDVKKDAKSGAKDAAKPDPDKSKADQAADAAKAKADRAKDASKNKP
jgi:hypothetical protein